MRSRIMVTAAAVAALFGAAIVDGVGASGGDIEEVRMRDRCDPATFTAAGIDCVDHPGGRTTLEEAFEELATTRTAEGWLFNPDETTIRAGERLRAVNRGGEAHTFSKVDRFGPGCVPEINELLGYGEHAKPVLNCAKAFAEVIPPGAAGAPTKRLAPGKHLFMCAIHPWMTTEVHVRHS